MQTVHRALTTKKKLALPFVCGVVTRVLAGLGHAHESTDGEGKSLGLVHRDVSLSNVIVTWTGAVKLIDFGIAKATEGGDEELTRVGQRKGKASYMSPEQVRREPLDARSDLFSVGILLWEMLTQRRLFARKQELDTMMAICGQDAAAPSAISADLPAALDNICKKALARDREERYASADQMRQDLEAVIADAGWSVEREDFQAQLAELFPEESAAALSNADAKCLYAEEPETMLSPVPVFDARPSMRSEELVLFNQQVAGPSVYDDWDPNAPTAEIRWRAPLALLVAVLSCLVVLAVGTMLSGGGQ
jgi:serine/threonine protein kinase